MSLPTETSVVFPLPATVKPPSAFRVLLLSDSRHHEDEILQAWSLQKNLSVSLNFELFHYVFTSFAENLVEQPDILGRVRAGLFHAAFVLPPAATWSRVRHCSDSGQPPLRFRSRPFGVDGLFAPRHIVTCAQCERLVLFFPEDLGGHSSDGPASVWQTKEFMSLESLKEAAHFCANSLRLTKEDHSVYSRMFLGLWSDNNLVYAGPLPMSCPCKQVMKGTLSVDQFYTSRASTFGPLLLSRCFENIMVHSLQQALGDGCVSHVQSGSPVALPSVRVVTTSLASSQSFSACPDSWNQRSLSNRLPLCCLGRLLEMGWMSVLTKWRRPVFMLFRVIWILDLRIARKVEVQKMLASLSPCLRQMVEIQQILASVSPWTDGGMSENARRFRQVSSESRFEARHSTSDREENNSLDTVHTDSTLSFVKPKENDTSSALGGSFACTPMVVPIRGNLEQVRRFMVGDLYIGRGSKQNGLSKSPWCNSFKVRVPTPFR